MKLLSLSSLKETSDAPTTARPSSSSWPWPTYCHQQPKTLSFRATDDIFRTINSVFQLDSPEPRRRRQLTDQSLDLDSSTEEDEEEDAAVIETALSAARSSERRLTFEPEETSSIAAASGRHAPFIKESVALSMDSRDPYVDFRQSMAEVVEAHALRDKWDRLEELLSWYLGANDKPNHGYILAAFADLVAAVRCGDCPAESPPSQAPSSPLLSYTWTSNNSCCSSSTLSTPCGVSVVEAEESCGGSGIESAAVARLCLPSNGAEPPTLGGG